MTEKDNKYQKLLIRFYSNVLDEETVETLWSTGVDKNKGLYKLENIPFYAPLASDDIVFAEFDEDEQMLTYRETIEYSGNSTIQVVLMDKSKDINTIRELFKDLGCITEKLNDNYFSMEVPAKVDYKNIKIKLNYLRDQNIIDYAVPCLAEGHNY